MKIAGSVMYMYVQHGRLNKWAVSGLGGVVVKLIGLTIIYLALLNCCVNLAGTYC